MFFSHELLSRRSPLGQIWLIAYSRRRLNRKNISGLDIVDTWYGPPSSGARDRSVRPSYSRAVAVAPPPRAHGSEAVISPAAPMALRMSSILMSGIVLLYQKQQHYLLEDFSTFVTRVKDSMRMQATEKIATLNKKKLRAKCVRPRRAPLPSRRARRGTADDG